MFKKLFKPSEALPDVKQTCEKCCINSKGYKFVELSRKASSKHLQGTKKSLLKGYKWIIQSSSFLY